MTYVESQLEFLADIDRYKTQRPFIFTPSQHLEQKFDVRSCVLNTIELELKTVNLHDIRGQEGEFELDEVGFEVVDNTSQYGDFQSLMQSTESRAKYRDETQDFLRDHFGAEEVVCYSVKASNSRIPLLLVFFCLKKL